MRKPNETSVGKDVDPWLRRKVDPGTKSWNIAGAKKTRLGKEDLSIFRAKRKKKD